MITKRNIEDILLLGLTVNTILPIDKYSVLLYLLVKCINGFRLTYGQGILLFSIGCVALESFWINYPASNREIFYPIFFLAASFFFIKSNISLLKVRNIFFVNVLFGLICAILANIGVGNPYSRTLLEKGLPDLFAPLGFSPTNQVFGTFCVLHLIISFEYRKFDWTFFVTIIALVLSFNRCSIIFLFIILYIYRRKVLYVILCTIVIAFIKWWKELEVLLSTATLGSRDELRYGVTLSFWRSKDTMVYLFGRGNSNTTDKIAAKTIWERSYIENGLDFILHSYGFLGLLVISIALVTLFLWIYQKKEWKFLIFFLYYLLIEQWMTHEFLASSFMFFMGIITMLVEQKTIKNSRHGRNFDSNRYI